MVFVPVSSVHRQALGRQHRIIERLYAHVYVLRAHYGAVQWYGILYRRIVLTVCFLVGSQV